MSRQANLLKQAEAQKAEQDRLAQLLTEASSKLLVTQASLTEVEQELQMLQAASIGAAPPPVGSPPKVNLSSLAILVQQCFVAAGVVPPTSTPPFYMAWLLASASPRRHRMPAWMPKTTTISLPALGHPTLRAVWVHIQEDALPAERALRLTRLVSCQTLPRLLW